MSDSMDGRFTKKRQLDPETTDTEEESEPDVDQDAEAPGGEPSVDPRQQQPSHAIGQQGGQPGEAAVVNRLIERKSRRKLKKQRKLVEAGKGNAQDYFDVYGTNPRAEVVLTPQGRGDKLRLQEVQGLVTWVLGEGMSPRWCFVKNKPLITKVVLLFVPGLDAAFFERHLDLLPGIRSIAPEARRTTALSPSAEPMSTLQTLLTCPLSKKRKERMLDDKIKMRATLTGFQASTAKRARLAANGSVPAQHSVPAQQSVPEDKEEGEISGEDEEEGVEEAGDLGPLDRDREMANGGNRRDQRSLSANGSGREPRGGVQVATSRPSAGHYVLTEEQMAGEEFPKAVPGEEGGAPQLPPGYVATCPATSPEAETHPMLAVDCEMCTTTAGLELTRVTLVDVGGKVLYDKLVVPPNPITDYNTKFSGITRKMLEGVTTTLPDVQKDLQGFVFAETILVGHALVNDLQALKLVHRRAIDTAVIFPHPRGPPFRPALRFLAERFLKRKIQGNVRGHDSAEDARAAMDLTLLKIRHGPEFGCTPASVEGEMLTAVLGRRGRRCSVIDRPKVVRQLAVGTASGLPCTSDADVLAKAQREVKSDTPHFIWVRFTDLLTHQEQAAKDDAELASRSAAMTALLTCTRDETDQTAPVAPPPSAPLLEVLQRVDERIGKLHQALRANTLAVLVSGHGDLAIVRRLQELKWKRIQAAQTGLEKWDEGSEQVLQEFQRLAKSGIVVAAVKS